MGYHGDSLASFVRAAKAPTQRAARRMADRGGAVMTERTRVHTPVETGEVRRSWRQKPTALERLDATDTYVSGVETEHWRAPMIEHGVEPHRIEPKHDADPETPEAIETPAGPRAGADHPGYPGAHAVAKAAAELEATGDTVLRPELLRWKAEAEAAARAAKARR